MIYTAGIRKVFMSQKVQSKEQLFEQAYQAGFKLAFFNGQVYSMVARINWIETPLTIEDFEVNFS